MDLSPSDVQVLSCNVEHSMYVYRKLEEEDDVDPFDMAELELINSVPSRDPQAILADLAPDVVAFQFFSSMRVNLRAAGLDFELSDQGEKGDVENRQHETAWYVPGGTVVQKSDLPEELGRYADENHDGSETYVKTRLETYMTFGTKEKFTLI